MRNRYFGIATFLLLAAPVLATATDRPRAQWSILHRAARAEILATIAGDTPDSLFKREASFQLERPGGDSPN
jgi:hypothetical protein